MSQIALPLDWPPADRDEDFLLSDANAAAVRHLEHWALWPVPVSLLTGPRKSGRSLLGRLFAAKTGGVLIDDAWRAPEETVFHAWNTALATRAPLLLVVDAAPPCWAVTLPDLASRLAATPRVALEEPDDALLAALIGRGLSRRGLLVSPAVLDWLVARVERRYTAIEAVVDALDRMTLARGGRLTIALARAALPLVTAVIDA